MIPLGSNPLGKCVCLKGENPQFVERDRTVCPDGEGKSYPNQPLTSSKTAALTPGTNAIVPAIKARPASRAAYAIFFISNTPSCIFCFKVVSHWIGRMGRSARVGDPNRACRWLQACGEGADSAACFWRLSRIWCCSTVRTLISFWQSVHDAR